MFELSARLYLERNGKVKTLKHFFFNCYKHGIITKAEFTTVRTLVTE